MHDCPGCPRRAGHERWVAPRREVPLSGILNVDKPPEMTSHDVVDAIRRVSGQRRVGHAGTLDPMATGVLLVCLGQATRVAEYLMGGRKRYRGSVVLGSTTDTYDADGEVTTSGGRTEFEQTEIEAALAGLVGPIEQVPPIYSALKQGGEPLHRRARRGETVEVQPRPVEIDEIRLLDWEPPVLILEIACSPGTYVRSLAHDLGRVLGMGATLEALRRTRAGSFGLQHAVTTEVLATAAPATLAGRMIPLSQLLPELPSLALTPAEATSARRGMDLPVPATWAGVPALSRLLDEQGGLLALATPSKRPGFLHPSVVLG